MAQWFKNPATGVPSVVQWHLQYLWSAGTQVWSLAWHSGLRIWCCRSCCIDHNCGSDLVPGLETQHSMGWPKKKKKKVQLLRSYRFISSLAQWIEGSGVATAAAWVAAMAWIWPLSQELPCAVSLDIKRKKNMVNDAVTLKNSLEIPQKIVHIVPIMTQYFKF